MSPNAPLSTYTPCQRQGCCQEWKGGILSGNLSGKIEVSDRKTPLERLHYLARTTRQGQTPPDGRNPAAAARARARGPSGVSPLWSGHGSSTCSHTSTIPYGMSLKTNITSLFDRRGARSDQTSSPPEAPTNSLKRESKACEQALRYLRRALTKRGARRRAASAARQPVATPDRPDSVQVVP